MTMQMSAGHDAGSGKNNVKKTGNFLPKSLDEEENYQLRENTGIFWACPGTRKKCARCETQSKKATQITLRSVPWGTDQNVHGARHG